MTSTLLLVLVLVAGACLATQVGVNASLARWSGSPITAAAISFAVGTVALVLYAVVARVPAPPLGRVPGPAWWTWAGGLLGGFYVAMMVLAAPRLGAATTIALVVAGQMTTSIALDHMGAFGFPARPVTLGRLAGGALIVAGVVLLRRL